MFTNFKTHIQKYKTGSYLKNKTDKKLWIIVVYNVINCKYTCNEVGTDNFITVYVDNVEKMFECLSEDESNIQDILE